MTSESGYEFRETTRTPLEAPVVVHVAGEEEILAKTANISAGGLFVAMRNAPPVGTLVKLTLDLESKKVTAFVEVVWLRMTSTTLSEPTGMGLQFRYFLEDGEEILRLVLP